MVIHDDKSIYSRDWGWVHWDEMDRVWWDEVRLWESKTIKLHVNGYPVGEIQTKVRRRRNRTW